MKKQKATMPSPIVRFVKGAQTRQTAKSQSRTGQPKVLHGTLQALGRRLIAKREINPALL